MMTPGARKLAVCMPAFNAEDFIETSIRSILDQTFADFTFLITDDCSTDGTVALLRSIDDPRLLLLENEVNLGPAATRNRMLRYCIEEGFEYMALMDADDVAFPDRLQKQVAILDAHPSLAACGSSMRMEVNDATWHAPDSPEAVRVEALFANPIPTPSATCRVQALAESGLEWDPGFVPCADYHFWYRLIFEFGYPASNTGEVDMLYTHSPGGVSHGEGLIRQEEKDAVVKQLLLDFLGIPEDFDTTFHYMKVALRRRAGIEDVHGFLQVGRRLWALDNRHGVDLQLLRDGLTQRTLWLLEAADDLPAGERRRLYQAFLPEQSFLADETRRRLRALRARYLSRYLPRLDALLGRLLRRIKR